jgi:hypothetical protein
MWGWANSQMNAWALQRAFVEGVRWVIVMGPWVHETRVRSHSQMIWNDGNGTLQRPGTSRKKYWRLTSDCRRAHSQMREAARGYCTLSESRFCTTQMWRENVRYWVWRGPDSLWARVQHGRRKLESRRYDKITGIEYSTAASAKTES